MVTNVKDLHPDMQKVYAVANRCIIKLINDGKHKDEAEGSVLEVLKEHQTELAAGTWKPVCANLRMIFLGQKPKSVFDVI